MSDWTHISGPRALIARLASLSVFIILGIFVYFSIGPSAGQAQLDRTQDALKKVHSWRRRADYRNASTGVMQTEINENSCPNNTRRTIIVDAPPAQKLQMDSLRLGTQSYERMNDSPWKMANIPVYGTCVDASNVMEFGSAPMKYVRERGVIKKGEKRLVDGVKCRDWSFISQIPGSPVDRYTVCIDSEDLPREIRSDDGELHISLSDYNSPITFIAPELPPPTEPSTPTTDTSSPTGTQ